MSARADSAMPAVLSSLRDDLIGRKLRLVGRVLCYEPTTGIAVLGDESHAIPVDVALCLHARGGLPWLVDARSVVTVFGYLERLECDAGAVHHARCLTAPSTTQTDPEHARTGNPGPQLSRFGHAAMERDHRADGGHGHDINIGSHDRLVGPGPHDHVQSAYRQPSFPANLRANAYFERRVFMGGHETQSGAIRAQAPRRPCSGDRARAPRAAAPSSVRWHRAASAKVLASSNSERAARSSRDGQVISVNAILEDADNGPRCSAPAISARIVVRVFHWKAAAARVMSADLAQFR
ncbi:hypothetical protein EVG20_g7011 [Dentipellis fragilis]|uniref:Uncharacterized protein n=1 Tax=Dentipellis fragilis TaxID=205917 RepID=A0A4Y9YIX2_9AGAM|nr:hypothetical protein EVG20_g7011 [Dentipellis fragilis]